MKQKTFFSTLVLFLFFFNLGILIVSSVMFRDTIQHAKERSLGEHYFIVAALIKDFQAVESRGIEINDSISSLLQPYRYLSGDNKAGFALFRENQPLYSNQDAVLFQNHSLKAPEDGNRLVTIQEVNKKTYVFVSGKLPAPYDSYTLVYRYDTTEAIDSWNDLKNMLFLAGFTLSVFLAFGLLLVLNRIFKPLQQISQTSRDIANGDYETRIFGDLLQI